MSLVKLSLLLAAAAVHDSAPAPVVLPDLQLPPVRERGRASWYGDGRMHGKITANGESFEPMEQHTCAHRTLPFGTSVLLVNAADPTRRTWCRINDRGPYGAIADGEYVVKVDLSAPGEYRGILDVSVAAAKRLGTFEQGLSRIEVRYFARAARRVELADFRRPDGDGG